MQEQEHKPNTSEVAAQLADDYLQARKSHPLTGSEERNVRPLSQIVCAKCKKEAKNCRTETKRDITCFTCNHYSANCPCVERRSDFQGDSELIEREVSPKPGVFQEGSVRCVFGYRLHGSSTS